MKLHEKLNVQDPKETLKTLKMFGVDTSNMKTVSDIASFAAKTMERKESSNLKDWANLYWFNLREGLNEVNG